MHEHISYSFIVNMLIIYKEGNNRVSSINLNSLVHQHLQIGNQYHTQDNTETEETLREHPFNLKGGVMIFSGVKMFFFASQHSRIFFATTCLNIIFCLQKQLFFKAQRLSANRILFLPMSETNLPT